MLGPWHVRAIIKYIILYVQKTSKVKKTKVHSSSSIVLIDSVWGYRDSNTEVLYNGQNTFPKKNEVLSFRLCPVYGTFFECMGYKSDH